MAHVAGLRCLDAHRHHHLAPPADRHTPLVPPTLDIPGKLQVPIHVCGTAAWYAMSLAVQTALPSRSTRAGSHRQYDGPSRTALTITYAQPRRCDAHGVLCDAPLAVAPHLPG